MSHDYKVKLYFYSQYPLDQNLIFEYLSVSCDYIYDNWQFSLSFLYTTCLKDPIKMRS